MGLLDDLSNMANKGIAESQKMIEVGKLKNQLGQLSKNRDEVFLVVGRMAYDMNRQEPLGIAQFDDLFANIAGLDTQMAGLQNSIDELQRPVVVAGEACAQCGVVNPPGATFCVSCGAAITKAPAGPACANCGASIPDAATFCVKCGAKVEPAEQPATADAPAPEPPDSPDEPVG